MRLTPKYGVDNRGLSGGLFVNLQAQRETRGPLQAMPIFGRFYVAAGQVRHAQGAA
jgi:hypothetical protein